jgi:Methyltransferase FkbM domain
VHRLGVANGHIREITIKTTTFDTLLDRLSSERLDIFQMDTEGADGLLLSLFPFDRVLPAIVHWEGKHMGTMEREVALEHLKHFGYRFATSDSEDMLATLI